MKYETRKEVNEDGTTALNHMRQQAAAAWKIYQSTDNEDWRQLDADEFVFELYARLSTSEARKETIAEVLGAQIAETVKDL